jgi:hypothetical protein
LLCGDLSDSGQGGLDGSPLSGELPSSVADRHGCTDEAVTFSVAEGDAMIVDHGDSSWPDLGTGFSFSVWVRLPDIAEGTSVKGHTIFAKPHPNAHQHQYDDLYRLSVDYGLLNGAESCDFKLFFADSIGNGIVWRSETLQLELTGDSILGSRWIHLAASYEYGAAEASLLVDGRLESAEVMSGEGYVWTDEGKNFLYTDSSLIVAGRETDGTVNPGFDGDLDDLILWNRALSDEELLALGRM